MTNETRKVYSRAIELVKHGWCRGTDHKVIDGRDCFCARGALLAALLENGSQKPSCLRLAYQYVQDHYNMDSLTQWNDQPGRTQSEVVALLQSVLDQDAELTGA